MCTKASPKRTPSAFSSHPLRWTYRWPPKARYQILRDHKVYSNASSCPCIPATEAEILHLFSARCKLPIYTLNMLNAKIYVVTSPELVSAVNRNSKALAFNPFIAQLGIRITGHDEATSQIVQHNLNGENGSGYVIDVHDGTLTALAPGKNLDDMTEVMLREISVYLQALEPDSDVDLFSWTRHTVTMCSTRAIYGPENPFNKNPTLVSAFW